MMLLLVQRWLLLSAFATWSVGARLDLAELLALRAQTRANEHECLLTRSDYSPKMKDCQCLVYYSDEARGGTLHSPNYPDAYPSNLNCLLFVLFANVSELIELNFNDFDLARPPASNFSFSTPPISGDSDSDTCGPPTGYACTHKVSVYLSEKDELHDSDRADCELCGSARQLPKTRFLSRGRSMFIEFHTRGNSGNRRGFSADYRFVRSGDQDHERWDRTRTTETRRPVDDRIISQTSSQTTSKSTSRRRRTTTVSTRLSINSAATSSVSHEITSRIGGGSTEANNYNHYWPETSCQRVLRSENPEGQVLSAKFEMTRATMAWNATSCNKPFHAQSPNTTFWFNGTNTENVQLIFHRLDLTDRDNESDNNYQCRKRGTNASAAFLEVFDGTPWKNTFLARLCRVGKRVNTLRSQCNSLFLVLHNGALPFPSISLKLTYRFVPSRKYSPLEICSKRLVSNSVKQGWLTSPGFPFGYAYNTTCVYQFEGAKNERIVIAIDTLDLSSASETADRASACTNETDRIVISTKSASNENLQVATLCGAGEAQQFMSASNLLNLTFIATPHVLRTASRGFNITYRFVTDFGLNSGSQVGSACHFIFDSTTSRNGTISSPNFPGDYPHDTECVYEFRGEGHERVQVWLPIFSVEESSECEEKPTSDYLEVQDFPVNSATTLVNRWCSQKTFHRHYRSEGNRATFKFKSNSKNSGVGFDGYYEFISTIQTAQLMSGGRTLQFSVLLLYAALCSSLTVL